MKNFLRRIAAAAALSATFLPVAALAQSGCSFIATGAVLTAAQWNGCFSAKQDVLGYVPVNKAGDVMLGKLVTFQSSPTSAGLNIPQGAAPTNPNNGDVWTTLAGMFVRINGFTIGPLAGVNSTSFAATAPIAVTFSSEIATFALDKDANFSTVGGNLAFASGGVAYPSTVTGGAQGAGTINAAGLYVNGVAVTAAGITSLNTDVVAAGPGAAVATIQANVVSYAKFQQVAASSLVGNPTGSLANAQGITLGATLAYSGTALQTGAFTGDATSAANSFALTLATVNANVGTFGSATQASQVTVNAKGLVTAASSITVTPAVGSITGLGTGVVTALGVNVGSAGAFVTFNGAGGTPSSMVGTNITGTAAGLTAGGVTTNANLTGPITSVGNATSIASQTGTGTKFVVDTGPTVSALTVTGSFTATGLVTNAALAGSITSSKLVGTDIATVGTLTAGIASTGFTVQASNVTVTGTFAGANVAPVANASGSPSATFGVMKADGTTIQCSSGTCSAVGSVATSIQVGVTTITSGTSTQILYNNGGTLGNQAATSIAFGTGTLNLSGNLATTGAFNPTFAIGASVTYTFPGSAANLAALNLTDQVLSGGATVTEFSIGTVSSGTTTIDCGKSPFQWMVNTGASTIAAPTATSSSCGVQIVNGNAAGAITLTGFAASPTGTGDTFATANTASATATFTNASANIGFTNTLIAGQKVYFTNSGGALPTNFAANTIYYVIATGLSGSNIQVSATPGGSAITAGSAGTGTQTAHVPSVYLLIVNADNGLSTAVWKQQQ